MQLSEQARKEILTTAVEEFKREAEEKIPVEECFQRVLDKALTQASEMLTQEMKQQVSEPVIIGDISDIGLFWQSGYPLTGNKPGYSLASSIVDSIHEVLEHGFNPEPPQFPDNAGEVIATFENGKLVYNQ